MSEKSFIIIGASAAGIAAAEAIRKETSDSSILLFSGETHLPYYRPLLSEYLGDDSVREKSAFHIKKKEWFDEQRIDLRLDEPVRSIHRKTQSVTTSHSTYKYDKLIVATGGKPIVPFSIDNHHGAFAVRTRDDVEVVKEFLAAEEGPVAVVGGGLLGIEAAWALASSGRRVTVIEREEYLMSRLCARTGGEYIGSFLEKKGIEVVTGKTVTSLTGEKKVSGLVFDDGSLQNYSAVLVSVGIVPESELACSAELNCDRGVVVDAMMRTSDPNIYAAGDTATLSGTINQLWMRAVAQGKVAGVNAAGGNVEFSDEPYATMLKIDDISIGIMGAQHGEKEYLHEDTFFLRMVYDTGGRVTGFQIVGSAAKFGAAMKLFKARALLDEYINALI